MLSASPPTTPENTVDDCTICLNALIQGTPLLTLSCSHKFHFQCLASNIQAKNRECPLCRATIEDSVVQLLAGPTQPPLQPPPQTIPVPPPAVIPSVEDLIDEVAVRELSERLASAHQAAITSINENGNLPLITVSTKLEYGAQVSHEESNIYGLITLQAPTAVLPTEAASLVSSRVPIDLVCVVDQSGSMSGDKIALLRQTLVYIVEQMNELDRLAIISFNTTAFDRSHGLKIMNQQNKQILTNAINTDITDGGGTYIGSGLQMGINLLTSRQTKNPLNAILLLTDGQDNQTHDYTQLMQTLPSGVQCHTFGYGPDHTASLLVQLAEQGNGGTFTYIDEQQAIGPAFAMALGGLFTCIAQELHINIDFTGDYTITNVHSKYKYEPEQLPSARIDVKLHDLNAEEKRNFVFQLHVPKVNNNEQNIDMSSQEPMSLNEPAAEIQSCENQIIGTATVKYIDPNTRRTIITDPASFNLVRDSHPPADLLRVDHGLDIQRNRVETANVLAQAMAEYDYRQSRAMLEAQGSIMSGTKEWPELVGQSFSKASAAILNFDSQLHPYNARNGAENFMFDPARRINTCIVNLDFPCTFVVSEQSKSLQTWICSEN
ncbi:unnamed protein product [Rotaria sp. Silwood1]|nr:unnamed protein product [Rotaria sp. Silwood1]CAF3616934.1 unnamed protein product [Rotaria sp. Silwood1]CAF3657358.1 unnamed protein product [Rotaria sp. Silwood1]CAF4612996.1 unnamed protein product [Rotaria sp. Silwood1]CAF4694426.1 unnamed protein product [Rotaria sp. Silwood1]